MTKNIKKLKKRRSTVMSKEKKGKREAEAPLPPGERSHHATLHKVVCDKAESPNPHPVMEDDRRELISGVRVVNKKAS